MQETLYMETRKTRDHATWAPYPSWPQKFGAFKHREIGDFLNLDPFHPLFSYTKFLGPEDFLSS